MDDRAFFCKISISRDVTNKKNGKKNGEKGFRKKEARRREKYVENWYYPTYYQAYVKMSNGDPHRMKPSRQFNVLDGYYVLFVTKNVFVKTSAFACLQCRGGFFL